MKKVRAYLSREQELLKWYLDYLLEGLFAANLLATSCLTIQEEEPCNTIPEYYQHSPSSIGFRCSIDARGTAHPSSKRKGSMCATARSLLLITSSQPHSGYKNKRLTTILYYIPGLLLCCSLHLQHAWDKKTLKSQWPLEKQKEISNASHLTLDSVERKACMHLKMISTKDMCCVCTNGRWMKLIREMMAIHDPWRNTGCHCLLLW